ILLAVSWERYAVVRNVINFGFLQRACYSIADSHKECHYSLRTIQIDACRQVIDRLLSMLLSRPLLQVVNRKWNQIIEKKTSFLESQKEVITSTECFSQVLVEKTVLTEKECSASRP